MPVDIIAEYKGRRFHIRLPDYFLKRYMEYTSDDYVLEVYGTSVLQKGRNKKNPLDESK